MKKSVLSLLLIFGLCSCSLPVAEHNVLHLEKAVHSGTSASQLLSIRIERWQKLQFSGLLGLRYQEDGLYYMLLDASGVKLLEAQVAGDGSHELRGSEGALSKSKLAGFLSLALARIYLQQPAEFPCSRNWMLLFCAEQKELPDTVRSWYKTARVWPFPLWMVETLDEKGDQPTVHYSQPWLGVDILLHEVQGSR